VMDDHHPDWFRVEASGRGFKWPFSVPEHTVLVAKEREA